MRRASRVFVNRNGVDHPIFMYNALVPHPKRQDTLLVNHKDLHLHHPSSHKTRQATGTSTSGPLLPTIIINSNGELHRFPLSEKQHQDAARLLRTTDYPRELHGSSLFEARLDSHYAGMFVSMLVCLGEGGCAHVPTFFFVFPPSSRRIVSLNDVLVMPYVCQLFHSQLINTLPSLPPSRVEPQSNPETASKRTTPG